MRITSGTPKTFDFACHSKSCAPPPAGKGGSDKGGSGRKAKDNEYAVSQALKHGYVGLTQRDAAPLVKAGLLVRGDGKGRGAGNTPVWEPTDLARRNANQTTDTRTIKFAGRDHKVVGETDTHFRAMKANGEVFRIPKSIAKVSGGTDIKSMSTGDLVKHLTGLHASKNRSRDVEDKAHKELKTRSDYTGPQLARAKQAIADMPRADVKAALRETARKTKAGTTGISKDFESGWAKS